MSTKSSSDGISKSIRINVKCRTVRLTSIENQLYRKWYEKSSLTSTGRDNFVLTNGTLVYIELQRDVQSSHADKILQFASSASLSHHGRITYTRYARP